VDGQYELSGCGSDFPCWRQARKPDLLHGDFCGSTEIAGSEDIMSRSAAFFVVLIAIPAFAQAPKGERALTGVWVLKSVDIGGKPAAEQDLKALLKDHGGVELGMFYKFRKQPKEDEGLCVLNNVEAEYDYSEPDKELVVLKFEGEGKPPKKQRFDVRFVDKNITLRFREQSKTVLMTFAPDE
jgi:hypothetical protein